QPLQRRLRADPDRRLQARLRLVRGQGPRQGEGRDLRRGADVGPRALLRAYGHAVFVARTRTPCSVAITSVDGSRATPVSVKAIHSPGAQKEVATPSCGVAAKPEAGAPSSTKVRLPTSSAAAPSLVALTRTSCAAPS